MVQELKRQASNARVTGSIPGQGTKIPHVVWHGVKKKKKNAAEILKKLM